MAGGFEALYTQDFSSTSSVTVTHNLDRVICAVRVIIGSVVRNDLVESVIPSVADPRNVIIVTLKASNSGTIQIMDSDYIWGTLPTPEGAAALGNNISGSTFSGSFTGSFTGDGSALTGITGSGGGTPGGADTYIQFNSGSAFSGSQNLTFDYSGNLLSLTGTLDTNGAILASSFSGDGSAITNAQVSGSNLLWVDISGSDTTGTRERFDKPYASIGGALSSASAGDVVVVRPGTYEEAITMVDGVSVVGMDRDRCILKKHGAGFAHAVTMADNCAFEHMSIDISASNGVSFAGTTAGTSAIRHARITAVGGHSSGVSIAGTPSPAENWITCDHVDVVGSGLSNAFINQSAGTVNLRDCFGYALVGLQVTSTSTTRAQDCRFNGFSGIWVASSGATLYADQSTRWTNVTNVGGGNIYPDLTHLLVATGSNNEIQISSGSLLSSSPNLTFDGSLMAITGTLSVDGNITGSNVSASAFFGDGAGITGVTAEWDGTHVGDAQITGTLYVTAGVEAQSFTGSLLGDVVGDLTGNLLGTASFADEAAKVSNALTASYGVVPFTYDGSSTAHVGVDTSLIVTLTGSQTLTNKIVSGTFSGSHTGSFTGSFAGDGSGLTGITAEWDGTHTGDAQITGTLYVTEGVEAQSFTGSFLGDLVGTSSEANKVSNSLTDGTGITNFTYDGSSAATVSIDDTIVVTLTGSQTLSNKTISGTFSGTFIGDGSGLTGVGGSPGGTNTTIQFNSGSSFSGSQNFTFDYDNNLLELTGTFAVSGSGGGTIEVTGTLDVDGNVIADRFDGLFFGDLTGDVTGNVLGNVTGDLVGTSSFADEAAKVSNALAQGPGIAAFSYDGSSTALVGIDNTVVTLTGTQTLSNKIVSGTFSGSFIGDGTALSITETDTLDDVTGRGSTTTNSITVNGITSNSNIILTGALDATGDIDNAGTYNGIQHYTSSATDPTTPTPSDGDRYYNTALDMEMRYDNTRSKWLSVEASVIEFGRSGNTGGGAYYRGPGNRAYDSDKGRTAEFDGTVVSISYTRNDTDSATFEVTANGTGIATLASSAGTGKDVTLNGDFTADQILGVKNQTGSNTTRHVLGWVRIRWRV